MQESPDSVQHSPDPAYIRQLIHDTGLTYNACADRLGIGLRTLYRYIHKCPYSVQYCLEQLKDGTK